MTDPQGNPAPIPPDPDALGVSMSRLADLIAHRVAPALERIASALERSATAGQVVDGRASSLAELRLAIREGEFGRAEELLAAFVEAEPRAPEAAAIAEELAKARGIAIVDRRKKLDASRSANDADAVLTFRDELAGMLAPGDLEALDRDVLRWIMGLLMKRMRTGTVRADVAGLASRVAGSFGHRPEGASLRASLPTLRRSAGLCPRCAEPYEGVEDACPKCLAGAPRIADLPETPPPPA